MPTVPIGELCFNVNRLDRTLPDHPAANFSPTLKIDRVDDVERPADTVG